MNLRVCLVLCLASAQVGCGLFDPPDGRDTDPVQAEQDGGAVSEPGEGPDAPGNPAENDAGPVERDAGGTPSSDGGGAPATNPPRPSDGGAGPIGLDGNFDWAADGAVPSTHDASASLRDGGLIKFDPDASGPVLNAEAQAACIGLLNNICNRNADCQVSLLGLEASQRPRLFESCRNSLWRARNCNRATRTASGFAQCSESTKNLGCISVLSTDLSTTCADQITLEP